MNSRRLTTLALHAPRPRSTVRLRLTLWYSGLFLVSGAVLLAITYGLVVQAFVGNTAGNALCPGPAAPRSECHVIGPQQARGMALQEYAGVLHLLLSRSAVALALMAVLSIALGWFMAGGVLRPLRTITVAAREISADRLGDRLALSGPRDELRELGDTFDALLARLMSECGPCSLCSSTGSVAYCWRGCRPPRTRCRRRSARSRSRGWRARRQ